MDISVGTLIILQSATLDLAVVLASFEPGSRLGLSQIQRVEEEKIDAANIQKFYYNSVHQNYNFRDNLFTKKSR